MKKTWQEIKSVSRWAINGQLSVNLKNDCGNTITNPKYM